MDIEQLATSEITQLISRTKLLHPYLNSIDRVPIWDGEIAVYRNANQKKENQIGIVKVQVKGREVRKLSNEKVSYPIKVAELIRYRQEGGTVFFVVQITAAGLSEVYYNPLLPYDINEILRGKYNQKSINVQMKKFPVETCEIENAFINFVRDKANQTFLYFKQENPSTEEFIRQHGVRNLDYSFTYTGIGYDRSDVAKYLFRHDFFLYLADCPAAHCGRRYPKIIFGGSLSPIVRHKLMPQTLSGMTADCRSLISRVQKLVLLK